ncbi:MAG: DUF4855 domain-containing protein [Phycisphaerae bacterium]|nr:DUF4855 domain-containing protein [Phycisphaerae bacterium]
MSLAKCRTGILVATWLATVCMFSTVADDTPVTAAKTADAAPLPPLAPNMVLLYYGFDSRGPRDWSAEQLRHYVGYHEQRGTDAERPTDTMFDTVLWMYRKSSRGNLFETSASATPTRQLDWQECLERLFVPDMQLNALEQAAAEVERGLGRPVRVWVVLTLPYPDVRIENWRESSEGPAWDFRTDNEDRMAALQWYVQAALEKWRAAGFEHLELLGFYWFNEGHINLRKAEDVSDEALRNDVPLIRATARYLHGVKLDGRALTLSWIPYSPYGGERRAVVAELLGGEPAERVDYLMVQPNYFFPRWKKQKSDLVELVRNVAKIPAGVEIECDGLLARDAEARQRFIDYLEVTASEHPRWNEMPAGYYQGLRTFHDMATSEQLAPLYERLHEFIVARRAPVTHKATQEAKP